MTHDHKEHEDCMLCRICGVCTEEVNADDTCPACIGGREITYVLLQYTGWNVRYRIVRFPSLQIALERCQRYAYGNPHRRRRMRHAWTKLA